MRRVLLLALAGLALAQAAAADHGHMAPIDGATYRCTYNPVLGNSKNPGESVFDINPAISTTELLRGIEYYQALWPNGTVFIDNRKFTFAKPVDRYRQRPQDPEPVHFATDWELTINPGGPQCTFTRVLDEGLTIRFRSCSDGHSRDCSLLHF